MFDSVHAQWQRTLAPFFDPLKGPPACTGLFLSPVVVQCGSKPFPPLYKRVMVVNAYLRLKSIFHPIQQRKEEEKVFVSRLRARMFSPVIVPRAPKRSKKETGLNPSSSSSTFMLEMAAFPEHPLRKRGMLPVDKNDAPSSFDKIPYKSLLLTFQYQWSMNTGAPNLFSFSLAVKCLDSIKGSDSPGHMRQLTDENWLQPKQYDGNSDLLLRLHFRITSLWRTVQNRAASVPWYNHKGNPVPSF